MDSPPLWQFVQDNQSTNQGWLWMRLRADRSVEVVSKRFIDYGEAVSDAIRNGFRPRQQGYTVIAAHGVALFEPESAAAQISLHDRPSLTRQACRMLGDWLGETIYAQAAAMGNIQLLNGTTLEIAVQRGFQDDFLKHFQYVGVDDGCACGRALRSGSAVTIEDVERDDLFAPHRQIAASAGFRAVQSVPLVNAHGNALGMLSVHYAKPLHHPEWRLPELRVRARYAAQLVERMLRQPVG